MSWIKVTDRLPPEDEPVMIHDRAHGRIETGRHVGGRWYMENPQDGKLSETSGVTHWSWILDSYLNDESEDD